MSSPPPTTISLLRVFKISKLKAFTLAEVLITLTIIGIIAAITVPNLMQKWEDHVQISAAKEAYAILDNAIKMAVSENGPIDEWNFPSTTPIDRSLYFGQVIKPYLKVVEDCSTNRFASCWNYGYNTDGSKCIPSKTNACSSVLSLSKKRTIGRSTNPHQNVMRFKLANNMRVQATGLWFSTTYSPSLFSEPLLDNTRIFVDTNGEKGPNTVGYDIFFFGLTRTGLSPIGTEYWNLNGNALSNNCSLDDTSPNDNHLNGTSCYYWIIKHNNMDYKRRRPADNEWW